MGDVDVQVHQGLGISLDDIYKRMRDAVDKREIRAHMRNELTKRARPVLAEVRQRLLGADIASSRGGGTATTGLRRRTANALMVSVTQNGVAIRVSAKRFRPIRNDRERWRMPQLLAGEYHGQDRWRHPTFGRRQGPNAWQTQTVETKWFYSTIREHRYVFQLGAASAIQSVLDKIARR